MSHLPPRLRNEPTNREIHALMNDVLGPPANQTEVSKRLVAYLAIFNGREASWFSKGEQIRIREAIEKARSAGS